LDSYYQQKENVKAGEVFTDMVIGISDGLVVPFVLVAAFSGLVTSSGIIVLAGLAEIGICSVAMALGGYQAGKTDMKNFTGAKEKDAAAETENKAQGTKENVKEFYAHLGLPEELQEEAAREAIRDKEMWEDILQQEQKREEQGSERARKSALTIGISYFVAGLVPLSPYFFMESPVKAFKYTVVFTLVFLFITGWLQSKITDSPAWAGAVRLTLLGAIAAGSAFFVTWLINQG
jgi:VIT1/CCC1 family predicted Fe2+/Mn2+ transporter